MELTDNDKKLLSEKGITEQQLARQVEMFEKGVPFVNLAEAATVGNGIFQFDEQQQSALREQFDKLREGKSLLKFVPASGAASRMFKALFSFLDAYEPEEEELDAYFERTGDKALKQFKEGLEKFAFYSDVQERIAGSYQTEGEHLHRFVAEILGETGLNYGFYPKGMLAFHRYGDRNVTPFEEHLKEAARYAEANGTARVHFTISPQHQELFTAEQERIQDRLSEETGKTFEISFSYQKPSTDTVAVNMDNTFFRQEDGSLLFRPGGHGALIENLNEVNADMVFIKNIDNVVTERDFPDTVDNKKMLGGLLLSIQERAFEHARWLDEGSGGEDHLEECRLFMETELNVRIPGEYSTLDEAGKRGLLKILIDRPIRVCGMVRNEGEPGGGPFFIHGTDGSVSLQIIESAQIDTDNPAQNQILQGATHFNPVDLVCGMKNYKGEPYHLMDYVDMGQAFIAYKTKDGKDLKALELPGLWNGAMAKWNTIFVEVPLSTFNPVKTVNDLLKPAHQA